MWVHRNIERLEFIWSFLCRATGLPTLPKSCWFLCFFCLRYLYMKWPSPSSPTETLSGLLQVKPQDISFLKTINLLCFPYSMLPCFHPSQVSGAHFKLCVSWILYSQYADVCWCLCVCVGVCVYMCALRIVSTDKILCFINTLIIYILEVFWIHTSFPWAEDKCI